MGEKPADGNPLTEGLQRYFATVMEGLRLRGELLSIEWQEEKRRLFGVVLGATVAALAVAMTVASVNVLVLIVFWPQRVLIAAIFVALYALIAIVVGLVVRSRLSHRRKPFQATFEELQKDRDRFLSGGRG